MIFFLDTEFNGYKGSLLSMALVPKNGGEPFYEVIETEKKLDPWVKEHAKLGKPAISFQQFQEKLEMYLQQYDTITIIADWYEDIAHFCNSMTTGPGKRLEFAPPTFIIDRENLELVPSKIPHHALEDAKAMRESFNASGKRG